MKKIVFGMILFLFPTLSFAFDLGPSMAPPLKQKTVLRYSGSIQPKTSFRNQSQNTKTGVHQESFNLSLPVYRSETDGLILTGGAHWLDFYPNPVTDRDLYNIQFGAAYTHVFEGEKMLSFRGGYGSASDKPFKDSTVTTVDGTLLYSFSSSVKSNWLLLLNYSNNRPILNNIPLPGFAYTYMPSQTFRCTLGAPFASIFWQFAKKWSFTGFTVVPWVVKTSVNYSIAGPLQAFTGFDFSQMTYLKHGRIHSNERIFYDEKKIFLGLKSPLTKVFLAELETGYAFDRSMFLARTYTRSPSNPTQLGASWYGKLGITAAF